MTVRHVERADSWASSSRWETAPRRWNPGGIPAVVEDPGGGARKVLMTLARLLLSDSIYRMGLKWAYSCVVAMRTSGLGERS